MEETVIELQNIVAEFSKKFNDLSEEELSAERGAGKWTRKEVIGHLIDSAHNNLRRVYLRTI